MWEIIFELIKLGVLLCIIILIQVFLHSYFFRRRFKRKKEQYLKTKHRIERYYAKNWRGNFVLWKIRYEYNKLKIKIIYVWKTTIKIIKKTTVFMVCAPMFAAPVWFVFAYIQFITKAPYPTIIAWTFVFFYFYVFIRYFYVFILITFNRLINRLDIYLCKNYPKISYPIKEKWEELYNFANNNNFILMQFFFLAHDAIFFLTVIIFIFFKNYIFFICWVLIFWKILIQTPYLYIKKKYPIPVYFLKNKLYELNKKIIEKIKIKNTIKSFQKRAKKIKERWNKFK